VTNAKSFIALLILALPVSVASLHAQPTSPTGQAYVTANAFPNLTFQDPTVFMAEPGTNRIFVCEREGKIWCFDNSPATTTKTLFLDLSSQTQGYSDSGLLGLAFHPQYGQAGSPNRGYVYVYYNYTPGQIVGSLTAPPDNQTPCYDRLSRFTVQDGSATADPGSELVLVNQFDRDLWHNGGDMFFGADGFLYYTDGDEGGENDQYAQTQKINSGLFSGVFRIDVNMDPTKSHPIRRQPVGGAAQPAGWPGTYTANYYIPNDNPWQDSTGGTLEEFYALGLRSPHRMTYDPVSGQVWIGDVGQNLWEEVDLLQKGANFQWSYLEGPAAGPTAKPATIIGTEAPPVYAYGHYDGNGCVIGGYVYRGAQYAADLGGKYIFADYNSNRIFSMSYSGSGTPTIGYVATLPGKSMAAGGITTIGQDANGELYFCTLGATASIYRLALPSTDGAGYIMDISARANVGTGGNVLIAGFAISGSGSKDVILRGVGPTLGTAPYNVSGVLATPQVTLTSSATSATLATVGAWGGGAALVADFLEVGAFALPAESSDSALEETLPVGNYTSEVSGIGGATGVALAEVYDADQGTSGSSLTNISARADVGTGSNVLIAGFVIRGAQPVTVLLRGIGPTLGTTFDLTGVLAQPEIDLYNSAGVKMQSNTGWAGSATLSSAFTSVGAFSLPSGSADAAMIATLPAGSYTLQLSGVNGTTGLGMVEVYVLPATQ
jgi:glucose/arabinose dehydrogenase